MYLNERGANAWRQHDKEAVDEEDAGNSGQDDEPEPEEGVDLNIVRILTIFCFIIHVLLTKVCKRNFFLSPQSQFFESAIAIPQL